MTENNRPKFDFTTAVSDDRDAKDGWCKGGYTCICRRCQKSYFGAKRSWSCADCAYAGSNDPADYQTVIASEPTTPEERAFIAAWKICSAWDGKITKPVLRKVIAAALKEIENGR